MSNRLACLWGGTGLWLRVFVLSLSLALLGQGVIFLLLFLETENIAERRGRMASFVNAIIVNNLRGRSAADASMYLDYFNGNGPQLWFERPDGTVLSGAPVAGLTYKDRAALPSFSLPESNVTIYEAEGLAWETGPNDPLGLAVIAFNFQEGPAVLCYAYWNGRFPHVEDYFYQGIVVVLLLSVVCSFWMARCVSRPLRRLRDEVAAMEAPSPERRVTVEGSGEVAEVATAVNRLTDLLSRHVRGVRELSANISHELRSPLTRMNFASTFIERGLAAGRAALAPQGEYSAETPSESRTALSLAFKHMAYLTDDLRHMEQLIGATLLAGRLDMQTRISDCGLVDISELFSDLATRYTDLAAQKGLALKISADTGLRLPGDEVLLRRMVSNLLDNALTYCKPRGDIICSLKEKSGADGRTLELFVENTHEPYPQEVLGNLFAPFYRAGRATGSGVGLGLALVQRIAVLHGGVIAAENTPRPGSSFVRFTALFPAA